MYIGLRYSEAFRLSIVWNNFFKVIHSQKKLTLDFSHSIMKFVYEKSRGVGYVVNQGFSAIFLTFFGFWYKKCHAYLADCPHLLVFVRIMSAYRYHR